VSAAQAQRLRERLLDPHEAQRTVVAGTGIAAVLAPLWERADGELVAVFIKRHGDLRLHAGQISFPGGRREPEDADLQATALREAHEEIGLEPGAVTIVGALTPTPTVVTDIAIYPFVGLIERPPAWTIAAREVDAVIEASLCELARTHRLETFVRPRGRVTTDAYTVRGETVWGATGRIVADLLGRLDGAGDRTSS
jgi:8-oxo-dGTP pyrophosphatase MutT (NUDIX family)